MSEEECTHELLLWHSPEVFSCKKCKIAMMVEDRRGQSEQ